MLAKACGNEEHDRVARDKLGLLVGGRSSFEKLILKP